MIGVAAPYGAPAMPVIADTLTFIKVPGVEILVSAPLRPVCAQHPAGVALMFFSCFYNQKLRPHLYYL